MHTLLYIHGFLSSPESFKAQQVKEWLTLHRPDIEYCCPALTPHPEECAQTLISMVQLIRARQQPLYLMGSSMGGFWVTYLAERFNLPAVLINPAVDVLGLMPKYVDIPLKNYHNDETYQLNSDDLKALARYDTPTIKRHKNYWLLVQTEDETLDYRLAVNKYQGCRQTVEQGGDHGFQDFSRFHEPSIDFFEDFFETSF